jgi:hypothetical protein
VLDVLIEDVQFVLEGMHNVIIKGVHVVVLEAVLNIVLIL